MGPDPPFDFLEVARRLTERGVRFLLFGRQAMRLYDSPAFTSDWDLWFETSAREAVLRWFQDDLDFDTSHAPTTSRPVVKVMAGAQNQIDAWFVRGMSTRDGQRLDFDTLYDRAVIKEDPETGVRLHIPSVDDMIALKRVSPKVRAKDEEDIDYLLVRKDLIARGELPPD